MVKDKVFNILLSVDIDLESDEIEDKVEELDQIIKYMKSWVEMRLSEYTYGTIKNSVVSSNTWKRYHVVVKDNNNGDMVLDRWFLNFENMKEELKELTLRLGWEGYVCDIREYRHVPDKWIWRTTL